MRVPENPLRKAGEYLAVRFMPDAPEENGLVRELMILSGGDREEVRQYFARKIADTLLIFAVLLVISFLVFLTAGGGSEAIEGNTLERPGYGRGDREEELTVQAKELESGQKLPVTVQERKYTQKQAEELLEKGKNLLEAELAGENASLDEVRSSLYFPKSLEDGTVSVEWMTIPYGIVDDEGRISETVEETGTVVEIQAVLRCQGKELIYETAACVYPRILTEEESFWKAVRQEVEKADEKNAVEDVLPLPQQVNGRDLFWSRETTDFAPVLFMLTLLLPCLLWAHRDQEIHQKTKERSLSLTADYAELLWKMTLLLGAGLTIRGVFTRIAADYQREEGGRGRWAYDEVSYTCIEMKSGIAEGKAYENFGKRCGLPSYIKLGSLLAQNLKKGSKGLASILEKEARSSMEERKHMARKLGEQAGTKLLFPMILMLAVVFAILIVPAFLSF